MNGTVSLRSVHGKYLSAQPDGRAEWNRTIAAEWEYFQVEQRHNGKITLKSAHGTYVSAQPDGSVQINRREAPPGGWEVFTVEDRGNNVVCLKSCHGKYLSAQQNGTAQWNRDHAPRGGWEDIQFVQQGATGQQHLNTGHSSMSDSDESIQLLEAVAGKPVRFKLNNPPNHNDAWVGIYQTGAPDQDHGAQNQRWKYIRDIDVNNVSLSNGGWAEGEWGIRVFSDGGYTLVERKDFTIHSAHNKQHGESPLPEAASTSHHTTQTVASQPLDEPAEKPGRRGIWIVALFGIFLILPGLPLLIVGLSMGEIGMIIPGAILTGFGAFLTVGAWLVNVSSWSKSYAESGKPAPRWTKVAAVFAVLLLIPGVILLVIGSISAESFVVQSESNATLEIFDVDDMGDQGFIIFIEAVLGDFDNNGIYDHCENIIVSATHSGSWMSDPWTGYQKVNPPDESRQVFELGECESGDHVEQKHKDGRNIIKMGQACYGCMKGTTTISAEYSDGSKATVMWIQDGEEVIGAIGMIIGGSIMTGVSSIALISLLMIWGGSRHRKQDGSQKSSIDILEATTNKGVYFRINNPPSSNDAWVGIYPRGSEDTNHGEEGVRWHWLRDIDVNKARFYEKSEGRWSIRVFSDSGFTLDSQDDFEIIPKNDQWWKD